MESAEEILKVVEKINDNIYDIVLDIPYANTYPLSFETDGNDYAINFLNFSMWDSENDTREYDDVKDTYEDLEKFIRRQLNDFISELSKIKV